MQQFALNGFDYIVLACYLLSFAGLAFFSRAKTLQTYWANDRSTGARALTLSLVSTIMGAGSIFAATSMTYTGGLVVISAGLGYALGLFLLAFWSPRLHKIAKEKNIYSFPDFLETIFSRRCLSCTPSFRPASGVN